MASRPTTPSDPRVSAALSAFRRGAVQDAVPLMQEAARDGVPLAMLAVAEWLATGSRLPRDPARALEMARRAAESGLPPAMQLYACLLRWDAPDGDDADANRWTRLAAEQGDASARAEAALWPLLDAPLPEPDVLHDAPRIAALPGLVPEAVCRHILRLAQPQVALALVFDPTTGQSRPHPVRRARNMNFGPTFYDSIVAWVNRRIAQASGTTAAQGEPLAVLAYGPGGEYRPHLDCLPPNAARPEDRLAESGQRIKTLLISLSGGYAGGHTAFTELDIRWRGRVGDALLFTNVTDAGAPEPLSRHAGAPVTAGEKWLASRWIRERPFQA